MNNRGIALLVTLILLGTIIATVLSISVLVTGETQITRLADDSVLAIFAADAGIEKLLYFTRYLNGNPVGINFSAVLDNQANYIACSPDMACSDTGVVQTLKSRGNFKSVQRAFELTQ